MSNVSNVSDEIGGGQEGTADAPSPDPKRAAPEPAASKPAAALAAAKSAGAPAGAPAGAAPAAAPAARAGGWLKQAADKVPTKWVSAAVVAVFLAATAAFGGMQPVEAASPVELAAGERHEGPMVALTLERAVLIDDFVEAGANADEEAGERVLAIVLTAENVSDRPVQTLGSVFGEVLSLESMPDLAREGAARMDDATIGPTLQPGVPAEVVVSWVVPGDAFAGGDEIRVRLHDHMLRVGASVVFGEYWDDEAHTATVTLVATDVGAGVDAEAEADGESAP